MQFTSEELVNTMILLYKTMYPNDELITPNFIFSDNFRENAVKVYKEFGYTDEYMEGLEKRASWNTTVGLTINNKKMSLPPTIVLNKKILQENTILHELTHVSDYYGYAKRNNFLDKSFMDLLELPNFTSIYLFSEFRAFYRDNMFVQRNLNEIVNLRSKLLSQEQEEAVNLQQLEKYHYVNISYCALFCAYMDKCLNADAINNLLNGESKNIIHDLIKFLYPLRNKKFEELEKYFDEFYEILETMISK